MVNMLEGLVETLEGSRLPADNIRAMYVEKVTKTQIIPGSGIFGKQTVRDTVFYNATITYWDHWTFIEKFDTMEAARAWIKDLGDKLENLEIDEAKLTKVTVN